MRQILIEAVQTECRVLQFWDIAKMGRIPSIKSATEDNFYFFVKLVLYNYLIWNTLPFGSKLFVLIWCSGFPRHRENREFGCSFSAFSQTRETGKWNKVVVVWRGLLVAYRFVLIVR